MRIERERIADQIAADVIGGPMPLARALHALARVAAATPPASVAPAARDGDLLDRIRRLARPDTPPPRPAGGVPVPALACPVGRFGAWAALRA
ncbi:hypothetical protein HGQ98_34355, partial [Achromobacter ruhlandii]|nr:hypothetical protein [Achromobacter ruhlandii]